MDQKLKYQMSEKHTCRYINEAVILYVFGPQRLLFTLFSVRVPQITGMSLQKPFYMQ